MGEQHDVVVDKDRTDAAAAGGQPQHPGLAKKMPFECQICMEVVAAADGCVGRAAAALCVQ